MPIANATTAAHVMPAAGQVASGAPVASTGAGPDAASQAALQRIYDQQNANQVMFLTWQSKISLSDKVYQICLASIRSLEK
jgi:hypothetical protein